MVSYTDCIFTFSTIRCIARICRRSIAPDGRSKLCRTVEEFLKENPNYQGYPDVERYTAEPAADTQEWYEWTQSGSSWYLYRKYYDGTTIVSTVICI